MRLLGAEVLRRRRRQPDAEGRDQRSDARLGHQRRRHLLPARLGARPASVSADGARVPVGDRPRGARADARARPAACRTPSSPASAAAATPSASSTRSSTIASVRLIGVEAGGEQIAPRPARRAVRRRQRRRAAGHAHVRAAGRGRQHRADALDLGRARLRGGRARARVAARRSAAPSTPTSPTPRRSRRFRRWRGSKGILPALESAHAIALRAAARARARAGRRSCSSTSRAAATRTCRRVEKALGERRTAQARCRASPTRSRDCARRGAPGLVTYMTAGDPDLPRSAEILQALDRAGADVLEVGVPFSDPLADGPVIQRATERALAAGGSLRDGAGADRASVRPQIAAPIVIFSYANPMLRMGAGALCAPGRARPASTACWRSICRSKKRASSATRWRRPGLIQSSCSARRRPTRGSGRRRSSGSGFLYGISRLGVTGARDAVAAGAEALVRRIRAHTTLPIALGFGISRPEHVARSRRATPTPRWSAARWCRSIAEASAVAGPRRARRRVRAVAEGRNGARTCATLDDLRNDIDRVDEVLVRLLNERARVRVRDRPAEEGAGRRGLSAGAREAGARARARASRSEGPLGAGRDRAAVRAHHRRSAAARAARRARRGRAERTSADRAGT